MPPGAFVHAVALALCLGGWSVNFQICPGLTVLASRCTPTSLRASMHTTLEYEVVWILRAIEYYYLVVLL